MNESKRAQVKSLLELIDRCFNPDTWLHAAIAGISITTSFFMVMAILAAYGTSSMVFLFSLVGAGVISYAAIKNAFPDGDRAFFALITLAGLLVFETTARALGTSITQLPLAVAIGAFLGLIAPGIIIMLASDLAFEILKAVERRITKIEDKEKAKNDWQEPLTDRLIDRDSIEPESTDSSTNSDYQHSGYSSISARY